MWPKCPVPGKGVLRVCATHSPLVDAKASLCRNGAAGANGQVHNRPNTKKESPRPCPDRATARTS